MSALAGIWHFDGNPQAGRECARMLAALEMYGPHARDDWDAGSVALGRNLFNVLPEDRYDSQPLVGGGGRFVLVADVRLDNRDELIVALGLTGAAKLADSAILLAAWERWGENCFEHLFGDYAFAVFDRSEQRLLLARDPMSTKPLYFHHGRNFVAFASMPKGLHALPQIPRAPDPQFTIDFLALMPEEQMHSFYKDVSRVDPGHVVTVTPSGQSVRRHWNPQRKTLKLGSTDAYAQAMLHELDRATRERLRGAGDTVGSHLSSGFDSSAVATSAALEMAKTGGKVIAFTQAPRENYDGPCPKRRLGDESKIAAETSARHANMEHVIIRSGHVSPLAEMERNFRIYDRPVLNLCNNVWANAINDAAKARGLTVLLSGQMGNMSISHDGMPLLPELISKGRLLTFLRQARGVVRRRHYSGWGSLWFNALGPFMPGPLYSWIHKNFRGKDFAPSFITALRPELTGDKLKARAAQRALDLHYRPRRDAFEAKLWVLSRIDLGPYHKGIAGGWGLDYRDPTADRRLFEFCLSIPDEEFLVDGETKMLARHALKDRVSPGVIGMIGKGLQAVDWHEGLTAARPALREEIARLENVGIADDILNLPRLKQLVEHWPTGDWDKDEVMIPYRLALLRGLSAGDFLRRASGSNA